MDSIIINLDSGKYVRFNLTSNAVDTKHEISANATVKPVNVYQFDRAVLYSPSESWSAIKIILGYCHIFEYTEKRCSEEDPSNYFE